MAEQQVQVAVDTAIFVARIVIGGCDSFIVVIYGEFSDLNIEADVMVVVTKVLAHETHVIEA